MDPTARRKSKLSDYSRICLTTLEQAGLTLALLKPLIEDRELRTKHIQADAFIAHQHLANILFGSFLTEVFSISERSGRQQASLLTIRSAIEREEYIEQRLEALWGDSRIITHWDDPDGLLDEKFLAHRRHRDATRGRADFRQLRQGMIEEHDELIRSELYINCKSARDKILAHKDTWKCNQSSTYHSEWFDRFGLNYSHAWTLHGRLVNSCKSCHLLLTRSNYILEPLHDQSQGIARRFWFHE
jgi:hypothetical protein